MPQIETLIIFRIWSSFSSILPQLVKGKCWRSSFFENFHFEEFLLEVFEVILDLVVGGGVPWLG